MKVMNTDIHSLRIEGKTLIVFWTPGKIVLSTYPFTKKFDLTFEISFITVKDISFCFREN